MKKISLLLVVVVIIFTNSYLSHGGISITDLSLSYTQNFNSLSTNDVNPFINDATLEGWFHVYSVNGFGTFNTANLFADNGFTIGGPLAANYGGGVNPNDRALGSIAGGINNVSNITEFFYGPMFVNNSSLAITKIHVSYKGEQWNDSDTKLNKLQFFYRIGGSDFLANNLDWTPVLNNALNFQTPQNSNTQVALDGNAPANSATIEADITGISILPGETFSLRWYDKSDNTDYPNATRDHGIAIDDVVITFEGSDCILQGYELVLQKPVPSDVLTYKSIKGFHFKSLVKPSSPADIVEEVSYFAFAGTEPPETMNFIVAGKFKPLTSGKKFKQGYTAFAKHKGTVNKPGQGIPPGTTTVTLIVKVKGVQGANSGFACFTNVFQNSIVK